MRRWGLVAMLAAVVLGLAIPAQGNHYQQSDAVWQVKCPFVGHNYHDVIAFPGQPGVSHRHDYFNIRSTADTTLEDLEATPGTCTFGSKKSLGPEPLDHASYWAPAIKFNGTLIDMSNADLDAYYFLGEHHPPVEPLPKGLKIIAGDSAATAPQSSRVVQMRCVDNFGGRSANQQSIPDCRTGANDTVVIVLLFPECWDGVNLDSPDHKSHMAYASPTAGCPLTHPVKVAKLSMTIRYLGPWRGGPGSTFVGCGNPFCAHADFFNAWDETRQQQLVDACLNAVFNCRHAPV